ncbi:aryl-alcohol oxidase-like protein [Mycena olivaceomarginata]|nr:aryl-alcohol oxidase-like protein [Mycena olivaceomarginata]
MAQSMLLLFFVLVQSCFGRIFTAPEQLTTTSYDFIVVGAGTAGCVISSRLSENPSATVLLIEAGVSDNGTDSAVLSTPFLAAQAVGTIFDWNYTTTSQVGLNGRTMPYPRGFVLGGSSSINSMVYARGPSEDWDRIATTSDDDGWSWNNLQQFIFKNERHAPAWNNRSNVGEYNPKVHGHGPLVTSLTANPSELDHRVINTTAELADEFPFNLDLNSGDGLGFGWLQSTIGDSARSSSATAYLHPALNSRSNLDLLLNTQVMNLISTGGAATTLNGVRASQSKTAANFTFTAAKEVILSAGTIGTPQILMLSGVGPKEELEKFGITTLVDAPDVGHAINAALAQYEQNKTGLAASSIVFNTIGFLRLPDNSSLLENGDPSSGPHAAHYQISFIDTFNGNGNQVAPTDGNWISGSVVLISPTSRGSINLTSSSAFDHPLIDPSFFTTSFDIGTAIEAVKTLQTFLAASAFDGFIGSPVTNLTTDAQIEAYVRAAAVTIKHCVSTAKISKANETGGVVGPYLQVKGVDGVRVVDASIFPFAVGGFPQAEVYIVAERAASLIKETWSL